MGVTSVSLGNFYTNSNGQTVLGGAGGSGLDTQALIKSLVAAKSEPITADQAQITKNTAQNTALTTFQNLLTTFQSTADALRNPPGVGNAANNVFKFTTGSVANGGSNYVSVTTSPGAALQSYNISNITSIASSASQSTGTFNLASANSDATVNNGGAYFNPGTISFNGANITINSGDSLSTIAATFNAVKSTTGVSATVIAVDGTHYQLSFSATNTGTNANFNLATATNAFSGVMTNAGLSATNHAATGVFDVTDADADATVNNGGAYFGAGTITFNGANITVHSGDSLNTIAASFNAATGTTGVTASVVNVGSGQYQLEFTSGSNFNLSGATDASGVLTNAGLGGGNLAGTGVLDIASANADATTNNGGAYFNPGTITFNGANITINSGDSLNTIAASFNAATGTTGVTASVVNVGSGQYALSFTSTSNFNLNAANNALGVMSNIGVTSSTHATSGILDVASADADATTNNGGAYFGAGTINFNGANITVHSGDSLNTIKAAFNAASGTTGVTASVVNVGSGQYELAFTSNSSFSLAGATDLSGALTHAGISTATSGTNANFELNGIAITRQTNNISDLINDVTFNLLQTTPDSTTNYAVNITPDTTTIQNTIVAFVTAYNAIQTFATQQTQLNSSGTYASTAVLANNQTFRQTMASVNSQIVAQVSGISGTTNPTSLADVGITLTNQPATSTAPAVSNILTVNDGTLTSVLSSNFQGVQNLFGFNFTSNNPNLGIFTHTSSLAASAFTLAATVNAGPPDTSTFVATFAPSTGLSPVTLTATPLSGATGYALTGPAGSALDGLQMIYASGANATINVTATQGVADQLYNTSNAATVANTGTIAVAQTSISTSNTSINSDITRLNTIVSQYTDQITQEFSALEQAISSANTILQSLNANENAALVAAGGGAGGG